MKKMGILLITIMLFSMIGVFDFSEVRADVYFEKLDKNVWAYQDWLDGEATLHGEYLYKTGGSTTLHASSGEWANTSENMQFSSSFGTNNGYLCIHLKFTKSSTNVGSYCQFLVHDGTYNLCFNVRQKSDRWEIYNVRTSSVIYTFGGWNDEVDLEIFPDHASIAGITIEGSESLLASDYTYSWTSNDYCKPWVDYKYESANIQDFTSVEITSDKTHYDMTDTQAIFTVTVADADGPVTGCTIDETITLPDSTTDTSLTWTDNGDGTYTSSPLTLNQYGMYQYECTVSKEGYNDGSDSGVFTRDEGPYQIIVQTNKSRYTDADESVGTTVIVSDGNNNGVPGCTITGEITKYDGTTLASWSDWTNPTEGYYQHTVSIADLGVTEDNVECSFSAEVTIPDYDTVETGSVSFTLNYDSGGGTGGLEISLSNTNIDYNTSSWSYSSTLTVVVTYDGSGVSGASVDVSTSPNGEGAAPLQVNPSSGETGDSGIFSASITCNAFDAVNGYTAEVTASYSGETVTDTIQITTEETGPPGPPGPPGPTTTPPPGPPGPPGPPTPPPTNPPEPDQLRIEAEPYPGVVNQTSIITVTDADLNPVAGAKVIWKDGGFLWIDKELGVTNSYGELSYTFTEEKTYTLFAEKSGWKKSADYDYVVSSEPPPSSGPFIFHCYDTQTWVEKTSFIVGDEIYVGVEYLDENGDPFHDVVVMIWHDGPVAPYVASQMVHSGMPDLDYEYFECFKTIEDGEAWTPGEDHYIKAKALNPDTGYLDEGEVKINISGTGDPNKLYLEFSPSIGLKDQETTIVVKDGNGDTVAGASVKIAKSLWWDEEIGVTDGFGMLTYTFTDAKTYKIYAEKDGYEKSDEYQYEVREDLNLELWSEDEEGNLKDEFYTDETVIVRGEGDYPFGEQAPSQVGSFEFYPNDPAVRFKVRDPDEDTSWYDFEKGYIFLTESDTHYYREDFIEIKDSWSLHPKMEITWEFLAGKIPECYWGKKVEIYMDLWLGSRISIEYPCVGSVILYVNDEGVPEEHGTLDGYIKDVDSHGIGGAYVQIKGNPGGTGQVTEETYSDSSGYYDFWDTCFPYGQWELTVTKEGYYDKVEIVTIDEEHEHYDVVLSQEEAPKYDLEITAMVQYEEEKYVVEDAYITIGGETKTTGSNGYVSFSLPEGTYGIVGHYTGTAGGSVPNRTYSGEMQVTLDSDKQIDFIMTTDESGDYILTVDPAKIDPNESATFTVVDPENDDSPVQGVEIWRMSGDIKMFSIGTTNSQGKFTKTYDSSGSYTYKGFKEDKTTNKVTLQVGDTPAELGDVNLRVNGVVSYHAEFEETVTFSVFDKEEKPISGASIRAIQVPIGAKVDPLVTDGAGKVEFVCEYEGVYVFKASYEGTDSNEVDIGVGTEAPGWPDIWAFLKNIWNFLKGYGLFIAIGIICIVLGIFTKNSFLFFIGAGIIVISILGYEVGALEWIKDLLGGIT